MKIKTNKDLNLKQPRRGKSGVATPEEQHSITPKANSKQFKQLDTLSLSHQVSTQYQQSQKGGGSNLNMNSGNVSGLVQKVDKIEEEALNLDNFINEAGSKGYDLNSMLKNVIQKQENESIKLQHALEMIDALNFRYDQNSNNANDLQDFLDQFINCLISPIGR